MKKIIYTIILIILFIPIISAFTPSFDIDMNNLNINNKSNKLMSELNTSYKIDTGDFKINNPNTITRLFIFLSTFRFLIFYFKILQKHPTAELK